MRLRILVALMAVSGLSLGLFAVPLADVVQEFYRNAAVLSLEREATEAASDVPADWATTKDPVELPVPDPPQIVGLYDTSGRLVAGDGPPTADAQVEKALAGDVADKRESGAVVVAVPVTSGETVTGVVRAETTAAATDARVHLAWSLMAALAVFILAVTAVAAWFLARRLSRPVQALTRSIDLLGAGSFDLAITPSGVAEIDEAQDALLSTAERLDEALSRERAFSAEVSHQLRTPVASLRLAVEAEMADPRPDPTLALREALNDIERLQATITSLLDLARSAAAPPSTVDIGELADAAVRRWLGVFAVRSRPLRLIRPTEPVVVIAREPAVDQALEVLIDNALAHGDGETIVEVAHVVGGVAVSVDSEGPPITTPDRIWAIPASSRRPRIGLPLARRLIEAEGGRLILTQTGRHATFEILLPSGSEDDLFRPEAADEAGEPAEPAADAAVAEVSPGPSGGR